MFPSLRVYILGGIPSYFPHICISSKPKKFKLFPLNKLSLSIQAMPMGLGCSSHVEIRCLFHVMAIFPNYKHEHLFTKLSFGIPSDLHLHCPLSCYNIQQSSDGLSCCIQSFLERWVSKWDNLIFFSMFLPGGYIFFETSMLSAQFRIDDITVGEGQNAYLESPLMKTTGAEGKCVAFR